MLATILIGVLIGLIVAGILAALRWLAPEEHRTRIKQTVQQAACRHDWQPIDKGGRPGDNFIFVTAYDEHCRKCGAERMLSD